MGELFKRNPSEQLRPFLKIKNESGSDDIHYSLVYEGLPEEFRLIAERELNETENAKNRGLQKLKEIIKRDNLQSLNEEQLLAVLRCCKYNMSKAEAKLKNFISARQDVIKLLSKLDAKKIERIIEDMPFGLLPYRDKLGRVIMYTRPYGMRLEGYEMNDVGLVLVASILFVLSYPITGVAGFAYFGECKSPSLYLFYPIFKAFRKYMMLIFSFPIRVSRAEILNENYMVQCFHKLLKSIVNKKIMDRVTLHGSNFEYFHELYSPMILPEEFGGKMGTFSNDAYRQKLLDFIRDLVKENT